MILIFLWQFHICIFSHISAAFNTYYKVFHNSGLIVFILTFLSTISSLTADHYDRCKPHVTWAWSYLENCRSNSNIVSNILGFLQTVLSFICFTVFYAFRKNECSCRIGWGTIRTDFKRAFKNFIKPVISLRLLHYKLYEKKVVKLITFQIRVLPLVAQSFSR